jgi:NADH dehydrogenase (ubiquinone) 1 alpha subcomplex subunit 10
MYQSESDGSESDGYEAFPTTPDRAPNYSIKMADAPPSARKRRPQSGGTTGGGIRTGTGTPGCPKLITLEGNIGVGKTYLATELAKLLGYKVFLEPTVANPYLEKFYADPKGYALKLQIWIYRQRFKLFVAAVSHILTTGQGVILDRSVFSDKIFADANVVEDNITASGYKHYMQLREQSLSKLPWPHLSVVLQASPEICNARIAKRSRDCESSIPVAYLELLRDGHQTFLSDMAALPSKMICMDWSTFGTAEQVMDVITNTPVAPWTEALCDTVLLMAQTELAQDRVLHVPDTPPEAVVEGDLSSADADAEAVLHLTERLSLTDSGISSPDSLTPGSQPGIFDKLSDKPALGLVDEADEAGKSSTKRRLFESGALAVE